MDVLDELIYIESKNYNITNNIQHIVNLIKKKKLRCLRSFKLFILLSF